MFHSTEKISCGYPEPEATVLPEEVRVAGSGRGRQQEVAQAGSEKWAGR